MAIASLLFAVGCTKTIEVSSVRLSESSMTLTVGESATLQAVVEPSGADYGGVTWTSSDASVASVSNGLVKANKVGTATITATAGGVSGTCAVTVDVVHVREVTLNVGTAEVYVGEELTLYAAVFPSNAENTNVYWSTGDSKVATVTDGVVTGLSAGTTTITVISEDGGIKATCQVTVTVKVIPVTAITLSSTELKLEVGGKQTLQAEVKPEDATDKSVTWSSSDPSVATVDSATGEVTAVSEGTATIFCSAADGSVSAACLVECTPAVVPVESLSLDVDSVSLITGETKVLTATVTPEDATDKTVTWSSSDPSVVEVGPTGEITAKSAGEATVTCTSADGKQTVACTVTVSDTVVPVTNVTLSTSSLSLTVGQTRQLMATVHPSDATNKAVTWRSNKSSVASVSSDGEVTGKSAGIAIVSVFTEDGSKSASCRVTVTGSSIAVTGISLDKSSLSLSVGAEAKLTATVTPSNATNTAVTWTSSAPSVATVSQDGVVKAVSAGSATITATTSDGGKTAKCTVMVKDDGGGDINIQSVSVISQKTINGSPVFLTASYYYYPLKVNNQDSNNEKWLVSQGTRKQVFLDCLIQYRVSGSTILDNSFDYSFLAQSSGNISMTPTFRRYSDGVLTLSVAVDGSLATDNYDNRFALKISKGDFSVVSDYAVVMTEEVASDFRIADPMAISRSHKNLPDEHYRRGTIGVSKLDPEAAHRPDIEVWTTGEDIFDAHESCDTTVVYDGALDLKTVTVPHFYAGGNEYEMTAEDMDAFGLAFVYEIVKNYKPGTPAIDESNYASLQNGVFSARPYYSNPLDPIGHTPIIRVKLMHGSDAVQVAYIKIFIATGAGSSSFNMGLSFDLVPRREGKDNGENIFRFSEGGDCLMTTFKDMNNILYGGVGTTKFVFHALFDSVVLAPQQDPVGTVSDVLVDSGSCAHLISWTLDAADLKKYSGKNVSVVARCCNSANPNLYVDVRLTASVL